MLPLYTQEEYIIFIALGSGSYLDLTDFMKDLILCQLMSSSCVKNSKMYADLQKINVFT